MSIEWTQRKVIFASLLVVAAMGTLSWGLYLNWVNTPPPMPTTAEQALATLDTPQFKQMPEYRQREYYAQANRLVSALPTEQRKALFDKMRTEESTRESMGNMAREAMVQRALEFASARPEDRTKLIDKAIDEMEAMRKAFGPPPGTGGDAGKSAEGKGPGPMKMDPSKMKSHIQDRIQHGNPQTGNLMAEYFRAMQARMAQRGIQPPRP